MHSVIIYQKATCPQTLGSEAQTKRITKNPTWGKSPGITFPQSMLIAVIHFWYSSGLQRRIKIMCLHFLCLVLREGSVERPQFLTVSILRSWTAAKPHGACCKFLNGITLPRQTQTSRLLQVWQVMMSLWDDACLGVARASARMHSLLSETGLDLNSP